MNANQPEKLVPVADQNRAPSADDKANPDELKDNLEKYEPLEESWRSDSARRNGATLRRQRPRKPAYRQMNDEPAIANFGIKSG